MLDTLMIGERVRAERQKRDYELERQRLELEQQRLLIGKQRRELERAESQQIREKDEGDQADPLVEQALRALLQQYPDAGDHGSAISRLTGLFAYGKDSADLQSVYDYFEGLYFLARLERARRQGSEVQSETKPLPAGCTVVGGLSYGCGVGSSAP